MISSCGPSSHKLRAVVGITLAVISCAQQIMVAGGAAEWLQVLAGGGEKPERDAGGQHQDRHNGDHH